MDKNELDRRIADLQAERERKTVPVTVFARLPLGIRSENQILSSAAPLIECHMLRHLTPLLFAKY